MPTGYTYPVVEGKVTEFSEFALECARAFGAFIDLRDEPANTPIPSEFKPSTYNSERLAEAKARLEALQSMTPAEVEIASAKDYQEQLTSHNEYERKEEEGEKRLEAMLAKVKAWVPPTADHVGLKEFMIEQLTISKRGSYRSSPPVKCTPQQWLQHQIEAAHKDIKYHAGEQEAEVARTTGRNQWLKALRGSL